MFAEHSCFLDRLHRQHSVKIPSTRNMLRSLAIVAGCLFFAHLAKGYSSGAPAEVCGDLTPKHPATPKTTKSPYLLHMSNTRIKSGESIDVTLKGIKDDQFKGFIIQARVGSTPVGKFSIPKQYASDVKPLDCASGNQNSVTHSNGKDKKEIKVTWTAPPGLKETVIFYYTVAKTGDEYWVAQKSRSVTIH